MDLNHRPSPYQGDARHQTKLREAERVLSDTIVPIASDFVSPGGRTFRLAAAGLYTPGDAILYPVDLDGFEPPPVCMQGRCSTNWSYRPIREVRVKGPSTAAFDTPGFSTTQTLPRLLGGPTSAVPFIGLPRNGLPFRLRGSYPQRPPLLSLRSLATEDSNLDYNVQSVACCRCTSGEGRRTAVMNRSSLGHWI